MILASVGIAIYLRFTRHQRSLDRLADQDEEPANNPADEARYKQLIDELRDYYLARQPDLMKLQSELDTLKKQLGEEVAAAVVLKGEATERDIRDFAAQRMADFKVPRKVIIMDEIPKGATGKMQRIGRAEKLGLVEPA